MSIMLKNYNKVLKIQLKWVTLGKLFNLCVFQLPIRKMGVMVLTLQIIYVKHWKMPSLSQALNK